MLQKVFAAIKPHNERRLELSFSRRNFHETKLKYHIKASDLFAMI
jgi:hypothetical protein